MAREYLFSGLIRCGRCEGNYRGRMDRKIPAYICSEYNNKGVCERGTIKESAIIEFVEKYCEKYGHEIKYTNEYMKSIIKSITVGYNKEFGIVYKDGHTQETASNKLKF